MDLSKNLETKLNNLIAFFKDTRAVVAFSGGVDSTLLAFISKMYAIDTLLITEKSILYSDEEIEDAIKFSKKYNINHMVIEGNPLENKDFLKNPKNRCYICKKEIFTKFLKIKDNKEFNVVVDGSNLGDLGDYRPGLEALKELSVFSPYIKFNINKQEIRYLSKYFNLEVDSKPSNACFASRIPYNQQINAKKLRMIKESEKYLKTTFNLNQLRVRLHNDNLARIELLKEDILRILNRENLLKINRKLKELGFYYITIDLEGFRSGSLNEILSLNKED